ncbi:S1/P1 Nuclease [Chitinophaga caeni]|uniref:S1/P1 Nuclease n=1 Tax=Chitinophaga caeni TaxID=2029983 RepID=A0A291QRD0_9BACT|nr:S1/P1 nuclease [Chitinophaga caeni]ATL46394.1 S1/P1 Nuclease [Chitinophaga caeni]
MHKLINFKKTIILVLILVLGSNTYAWGPTGHRVVAEIANRHLSSRAKKAIAGIIGNESLAMIANWPDFIKSDTTNKYKHTSPWHYVDFPGHISRETFDEMIREDKAQGELYKQTLAMIEQLKNPASSKEEKRFALSFLVHMIGDMHQPLHVGHDEDQGGNKISVKWFDKPTNLHRVWDEHLIDFQQLSYTEYTNWLDRSPLSTIKTIQGGSITDWLFESHLIADKIYDRTKDGDQLSYRYNYIFVNDLNNQLLKGGLRLAKVLNDIYK